MQYLLPIIATGNFAAGLTLRSLDPVLPQIATEFGVDITTAATLTSITAVSFAFSQLPLGAVADHFGKPRLILTCLVLLGLGNLIGAFAPSFELLLASRVICGVAAGGVFPIAVGLVGDLFPVAQRRVAISRIVAGTLTGNLLGSSFSGVIGDFVGWRGVLVVLGIGVLLLSLVVAWGFRDHMNTRRRGVDVAMLLANYRRILTHPNARLCYLGVFFEGACVQGLNPYVASFLQQLGEPRLSIAGLVLAGYGIGGITYAVLVSRILKLFGDRQLMRIGAALIASQIAVIALGPPWQAQIFSFMVLGIGFHLLHGGFQLITSEIAPDARASAVSLQSFCFNCGVTAGPIAYGAGLVSVGKLPTLLTAALLLFAVGLFCAQFLAFKPHRTDEDEVPAET